MFAAWAVAVAVAGQAAAAAQPDAGLIAEARLAAKYPGLFQRNGKTLQIGKNEFTDAGSCMDNDPDCVFYRADRVYGGYVGVWVNYYEQGTYMLVDPKNAIPLEIGDRPLPSPTGKRFAVSFIDEMNDWSPLHGLAVWEWQDHGPVRLRVVDYYLRIVERVVGWHGDSCLELATTRPDRTMWLAEYETDWALTTTRPPICTD
jgi:hypothetical protein